jgi:DNA-binding response OmpR family regulator
MENPAAAPLVLVADDDPDILDLVRFRLERSGFEVATADNGTDAVRLAGELAPALAVVDVMMPGLTGFDVTRRLRQDPDTAGIPVILLTARAQEADVQEGFAAGADDYLRKPFSPRELSARVQAVLGRR